VWRICEDSSDRRMMANLFCDKSIILVRSYIFIGLVLQVRKEWLSGYQKRIERLGDAINGRCILTGGKCSNISCPFRGILLRDSNIQEIHIFHILTTTLEKACTFVETYR